MFFISQYKKTRPKRKALTSMIPIWSAGPYQTRRQNITETHSHLQRMKTACFPYRTSGTACAHDDRKSAPHRTYRRRRQTFSVRKRHVAVPAPPRVFQYKTETESVFSRSGQSKRTQRRGRHRHPFLHRHIEKEALTKTMPRLLPA